MSMDDLGGPSKTQLEPTSWFMKKIQEWALYALKQGAIPKHIAFIMDGNRRYARQKSMAVGYGHSLGFERLRVTLDWCLNLGVKMVTVYAFSLENFKRSKDEVDYLMRLCKAKLEHLMKENELIEKHGVRINIIGDITKLPRDLQEVVGRIVTRSRKNSTLVLNIALAYTSQHEITEAVKTASTGVKCGLLEQSDVDEHVIEQCLLYSTLSYGTEDAQAPDLLVRTSGEVRLSDFLLWQSGYSCVRFTNVLWPDFSMWDFVQCVVHYQQSLPQIVAARLALDKKQAARRQRSDADALGFSAALGTTEEQRRLAEYQTMREERIAKFLASVRRERLAYFEGLTTVAAVVA